MQRYRFEGVSQQDEQLENRDNSKLIGKIVTQITINRLTKNSNGTYQGLWKGKWFWGAKFIKI